MRAHGCLCGTRSSGGQVGGAGGAGGVGAEGKSAVACGEESQCNRGVSIAMAGLL